MQQFCRMIVFRRMSIATPLRNNAIHFSSFGRHPMSNLPRAAAPRIFTHATKNAALKEALALAFEGDSAVPREFTRLLAALDKAERNMTDSGQ